MSLAPEWVAGKAMAEASLWTIWHQTAEVLKVKLVQVHPGSVFLKRPAPGVTSRLLGEAWHWHFFVCVFVAVLFFLVFVAVFHGIAIFNLHLS